MEFQVTDVKQPIMSVGKFCSRTPNRVAWYDGNGGLLKHETAGLVKLNKHNNHYALECWIRKGGPCQDTLGTRTLLAPIGAAAAAARPGEEDDGHAVQRAL